MSYRVATFAFALLVLAGSVARAKDQPNIVLIISDDQSWTDYGFMGHETIQTPHLDRLARESLTFTRGYVPDSLCRPSLATMVTFRRDSGPFPMMFTSLMGDVILPPSISQPFLM